MDKVIVYPGQVPEDTDVLAQARAVEYALGYLIQGAFGTGTVVVGLAVTQQSAPNMTVQVGPGAILTSTTVDPTGVGYGSLPPDTNNLCKAGINAAPVNMSALVAPSVSGQSQNTLLEAQFLEQDGDPIVLPYYNAASPSIPYTGPANAGTSQNTRRYNKVQLQWKSGSAATTGTQVTPSPDSGWVGLAVVTVANGQSTITNANIAPYVATPVIPTTLPNLRKKLTANLTLYVSPTGNDSNSGLASWDPYATRQKAWNTLVGSYDLNGYSVTVNCANGTATDGLAAQGILVGNTQGASGVTFVGNTGSPTSCIVNVASGNCFSATNGAQYSISGFKMLAGGSGPAGVGNALVAQTGGFISLSGPCEFGACSNAHMNATVNGTIGFSSGYNITGSALYHWSASATSSIIGGSNTIFLSGTPAFTYFAYAYNLGSMNVVGISLTGSGATGQRYYATMGGIISTNGGGSTYLPGSTSGSGGLGGQYA